MKEIQNNLHRLTIRFTVFPFSSSIRSDADILRTDVLRSLSAAGMKVLKWLSLGATILLLVCQVALSQLCNSNTILMDGFHTLFILISIALSADTRSRTPPDSLVFFVSPLHASNVSAESLIEPHLGTRPFPYGENLRQVAPPALGCGLTYQQCRIPIVGSFLSALVLASLCLSSTIDIIGLLLEPKRVYLPLLLVVTSFYSLLLKMLFLWLYWDQLSDASLQLNRDGTLLCCSRPRVNSPVTVTSFCCLSINACKYDLHHQLKVFDVFILQIDSGNDQALDQIPL